MSWVFVNSSWLKKIIFNLLSLLGTVQAIIRAALVDEPRSERFIVPQHTHGHGSPSSFDLIEHYCDETSLHVNKNF